MPPKFTKKLNVLLNNIMIVQKNNWKRFVRSFYEHQHQLTSTTGIDRYPELFREASAALSTAGPVSILSFGCSTGEECFTLLRYFPDSQIIGADINTRNLRKAQNRNPNPARVKFIESTPANLKHEGKYDAIFCLSVLCRWEETKDLENCNEIYPFEKFESVVALLCDQLNPNGIFVLYNANYLFEDTQVAQFFEPVVTPSVRDSGFVHKFDKWGNRNRKPHSVCIFRKKSPIQ